MRKYKKHRLYPKIYPKARAFARREYVEPYELDALDKGFYHGYVAGVKAMQRALNALPSYVGIDKRRIKRAVDRIIGEGKLL